MTGVPLAEELLLLAYDDETGKATMPRISLDLGMAAAVLIELALAGRIAYAEGNLAAVDPTPTGEPLTDEVLARIVSDTPHSPSSWVQRLRHGLRDRILGDLCAQGVVRDVDETELGFIHVHRYPVVDPSVEADTRQRLADALAGAAAPDERTAALATLVAVLRMEGALGVSGEAATDARRRLEEIASGAGFSGTVGLEDSVVRPSVGLVVATLGHAVDAALGRRP
ncbi:GOLPH3/VPS74 family protein [Micromonospora endolithica]|uniref:GPP34 family phosphoprotein n=1 Tax=Micromonospora endolithica TaxID=230091 RepID=A0A3A9Z4V2_9ACTN|nr:GPP34 family phosphoprotein [Micromonospora endolithica]RKN43482.1 GPP34 family phosphoprotein [Micromonospora endolithica]TWJ24064.1 Golgi phosphoprotein 3 GPP34 [Micromonospora endolithica]